MAEAASLLDACLSAACSSRGGRLRRLCLFAWMPNSGGFTVGGWAATLALQPLQHLFIQFLFANEGGSVRSLQICNLSALRSLRLDSLRGLWIDFSAPWAGHPILSTAAAELSLSWLCFGTAGWRDSFQPLPPGPWQRTLCHVILDPGAAKANVGFLEGLSSLERLSLLRPPTRAAGRGPAGDPGGRDPGWEAFWRWTARHGPLRRLEISILDMEEDPEEKSGEVAAGLTPEVEEAVEQLAAERPGLQIELLPCTEDDEAGDIVGRQLLAEWD
ncbi:hypothetical protein ABPG75_010164 [Micractinium tetrahymenae]